MSESNLNEIESKIRNAKSISDERKNELLQLLGTLESEVEKLSRTHDEHAHSIAGFAELSAHEAMRAQQNPQLLQHSLEGLRSSVAGFEESHPQLVQIVHNISNRLANLGF